MRELGCVNIDVDMKNVINNWVHIPGIHCGSVAIRDVTKYYGYNLSEPMCFGLGGGLGFFYTVREDMNPTRVIHLRGPGMEPNFFSLIGDSVDWRLEEDSDRAFELLKGFIDSGVPVLVQTDIFYLDYYNSSTHFPGHVIPVWGYDDESEIVFVSDTGFDGLQRISYENFRKARSSKANPYPLFNNWFEVKLELPISPLSDIIPKAIRKNAEFMIEGRESSRGISSVSTIRSWADDLLDWGNVEDWKWSSRFAYQVITKRGTCGAGFRFMYRDFLLEAQEMVPSIRKLGLVEMMDRIGNEWSGIALLLKSTSETEIVGLRFNELSVKARDIAGLEEEFYIKVLKNIP